MRLYINENYNLPTELSFLLQLIAKEVAEHARIFLPEKKLLGTIKKNNILKIFNLSGIEIIENLDQPKSEVNLKENLIKKDTLIITLGQDFYQHLLHFKEVYQKTKSTKNISPYHYVLNLLKIILSAPLSIKLEKRLKY